MPFKCMMGPPEKDGKWTVVGHMPVAMSDHCLVPLNKTHVLLNAGEWSGSLVSHIAGPNKQFTGNSTIYNTRNNEFTPGVTFKH